MEGSALCLGYGSAIEYWRTARRRLALCNTPDLLECLLFDEEPVIDLRCLPQWTKLTAAPTHPAPGSIHAARRSLRLPMGKPLDYVVSEQRGREHVLGSCAHLCAGPYPSGTFRLAEEGFYVVSPELALAQLAGRLDDVGLLELLCEFMGFFVLDGTSETGLRHGPPVLTEARLRSWVQAAGELRRREGLRLPRGIGRLMELLDLAVEFAASPGEVRTALLYSLPIPRGGYGLRKPELNVLTMLRPEDSRAYGADAYACDLTWRDAGTMMEYRGELVHKQRARKLTDARKGNILGHLGYEVMVVEHEQLMSLRLADELAGMLADNLGVPLVRVSGAEMTERLNLRRRLLGRWVEV